MNGYLAPYKSRAEIHTPKLRGDKRKAVFIAFDQIAAENPDTFLVLYEDSKELRIFGGFLSNSDALDEAMDNPKLFLSNGGALGKRMGEVEDRLNEINSQIDELEGERDELDKELRNLQRKAKRQGIYL